jgi:hypothetical protein
MKLGCDLRRYEERSGVASGQPEKESQRLPVPTSLRRVGPVASLVALVLFFLLAVPLNVVEGQAAFAPGVGMARANNWVAAQTW